MDRRKVLGTAKYFRHFRNRIAGTDNVCNAILVGINKDIAGEERLDQFFPLATTFLKCYAFRQEDPFILLGIDHLLAQLYDHFFITRLHLHHIPHTNPPFTPKT